jgi:hypothetical protein
MGVIKVKFLLWVMKQFHKVGKLSDQQVLNVLLKFVSFERVPTQIDKFMIEVMVENKHYSLDQIMRVVNRKKSY